ncbi:hypothetical protein PEM_14635 [Stenotrophomonas sp. Pemsol]|nr:hypothetical protein PEM_14635 [Stenotrophomonas sp. Pemsol]MCU1005179.1 hypothetical protein [Stenotrophomonas maltophilia]
MRYGTLRATSLMATPNLAPLVQAQQMPQQHRSPVHLATADDTDYEDMARVLLAVSQHGLRVDAPGH